MKFACQSFKQGAACLYVLNIKGEMSHKTLAGKKQNHLFSH